MTSLRTYATALAATAALQVFCAPGGPAAAATARPVPPPVAAPAPAPAPAPAFRARVGAVPMAKLGRSWHPGCPVALRRLRLITMDHWGFDGRRHTGEMVVRDSAVRPMLHVFGKAFAAKFPIRQMRVLAEFGGDDEKAMAADNTSAFNCRDVTGDPGRISQHAYGDAVDINTLENPYVDVHGRVHPAAGHRFLDRSRKAPGMIKRGDVISRAMREVGWEWGGRWWMPDYQHFSANGR
ncbi:M15 family metallopeptidase [Streptomyces sp. NPDC001941]|uniref:M15 family metallopeptidase n=1 Tax=Streptomyces sp. NPDC001941 TaxID=3154659 RepID=UPI00331B89EC